MKTPLDQQLDAHVAAGCPVDSGWRGWVGLIFGLIVLGLPLGWCAFIWKLFMLSIQVKP